MRVAMPFLHKTIVAAGLALFSLAALAAPLQAEERLRGVVEMFTSQGCSSCPPADRVLAHYAAQDDVLALSWHVDYWNYLGWKDTFSRAEFSKRQYDYAKAFKRRGVYTPQAVVNGREHVVGSHHGEIEARLIAHATENDGLTVPLSVTRSAQTIRIKAASLPEGVVGTLWIVYYDPERRVNIKRGENRGKAITYHNVVRETAMLGMVKSASFEVELPLAKLSEKGFGACAVILQREIGTGLGPIIGAARIGPLDNS